jgi:4-carboxymuconolactone decarboxylase
MSRIPYIRREDLSEAQQRLFDGITRGERGKERPLEKFLTPEGGLAGPFNALLYSPILGDAAQRLGEGIRFHSAIPPRLRELAILIVAADWKAEYEWYSHEKIGRREGLPDTVMESIRKGEIPVFADSEQSAVYRLIVELLENRQVSDPVYEEVIERLGEPVAVELVMLAGYYAMISMILNVFKVPLPPGEKNPFS